VKKKVINKAQMSFEEHFAEKGNCYIEGRKQFKHGADAYRSSQLRANAWSANTRTNSALKALS
jgi:hypothetical protein